MGCITCKETVSGTCKVCELVDNDISVKTVAKCELCNVYMCKDCKGNPMKRFLAVILYNI